MKCAPVIVLLLGVCVGCIEVEQDVVLGAANDGRFALRASVPVAVWRGWLQTDSPLPGYARCFDPRAGEECFPAADGFKLEEHRVFGESGRLHVVARGQLTDARQALASGRLGPFKLAADEDGAQRLTARLRGERHADPADLATLADGARLVLRLEAPGEIVRGNATRTDGRQAIWEFTYKAGEDLPDVPRELLFVYR